MIHVEHLHKRFGQVCAVDDVSFEVARGEVVGLLGPNGAGKTTTMRIITGYVTADRGRVAIDGIPVDEDHLEARRRIGYLPENAPLYLDLETTAYLSYIANLRGIPGRERTARIREMVSTCGLREAVGRPIGQLSKGYRQRVGLAAAMIHHPPILILDEPTSGLDPNQIVEIRDLIRNIGRERTVVLSTHILQEVEATCSRAMIINAGKLVGIGTLAELLQQGQGRATYTVALRAPRERIEQELPALADLSVDAWLSEPKDERQRVALAGADASDHSEEIFRWAVAHHFVLSELTRETASLEEVFRELTQDAQDAPRPSCLASGDGHGERAAACDHDR